MNPKIIRIHLPFALCLPTPWPPKIYILPPSEAKHPPSGCLLLLIPPSRSRSRRNPRPPPPNICPHFNKVGTYILGRLRKERVPAYPYLSPKIYVFWGSIGIGRQEGTGVAFSLNKTKELKQGMPRGSIRFPGLQSKDRPSYEFRLSGGRQGFKVTQKDL